MLDDAIVKTISPTLDSDGQETGFFTLAIELPKMSTGFHCPGDGFFLPREDALSLIENDPECSFVVLPFLDGEALVTSPMQDTDVFVISFTGMNEQEARRFGTCYNLLRDKVYPERLEKAKSSSYGSIMNSWWLFWRPREDLYHEVNQLDQTIVAPIVAKYLSFSMVPTRFVFGNKLVVIPSKSYAVVSCKATFMECGLTDIAQHSKETTVTHRRIALSHLLFQRPFLPFFSHTRKQAQSTEML